MSDRSTIEWTDATWNPVTGCSRVSPGCAHCYALTFAERFRGVAGHPYEVGFDLTLRPDRLTQPLAWKRSRRIFVNSMSDLFHEDVPDDYIRRVFSVMAQAHWHVFQVLTKRHERLVELSSQLAWPQNVWMGVSVENQRWAVRAEHLKSVPCAVRFVSAEPLLGPLRIDMRGLDWVIVGGESGPRARPMRREWVCSLQEQCRAAGVAFFFKQWGAHNELGKRVGKGQAGRILDGHTWNAQPELISSVAAPSTASSTRRYQP